MTSDVSNIDYHLTRNLVNILPPYTLQFPEGKNLYLHFNTVSWHMKCLVEEWREKLQNILQTVKCNIK